VTVLLWLVFKRGTKTEVVIYPAQDPSFARIKLAIDLKYEAPLKEFYRLDAKTARKVPKNMIGKVLSQRQAAAVLKKIG